MKTILLIAILCLLPSCETARFGDPGGLPPLSGYVGSANVLGGEMRFGNHALGLGLTYRSVPDWEAPPTVEVEIPYRYPLDEK